MNAKHEFKTGDIVQLKSGGPNMTVGQDDLIGGKYVRCQWFSGRKLESGDFTAQSLVRAKDV